MTHTAKPGAGRPSINLRLMAATDIPAADELRALAGWNQTLADWGRFLAAAPEGCFVAECDGTVVGTATTTCYGTDLAWIGMVLVHPDRRCSGIGTALLERCLAHLREAHVRCIKLDATPMGKPVYERLGFRAEWSLARWEIDSAPNNAGGTDQPHVRPLTASDWPALGKLDAAAFGVERGHLLRPLAVQSAFTLVSERPSDGLVGYGMMRQGSRAWYLGPMVDDSSTGGLALARVLLEHAAGQPVYWDIPDINVEAVTWARQSGFTQQRSLLRMFLGENACPGDPRRIFGILAPEMG